VSPIAQRDGARDRSIEAELEAAAAPSAPSPVGARPFELRLCATVRWGHVASAPDLLSSCQRAWRLIVAVGRPWLQLGATARM